MWVKEFGKESLRLSLKCKILGKGSRCSVWNKGKLRNNSSAQHIENKTSTITQGEKNVCSLSLCLLMFLCFFSSLSAMGLIGWLSKYARSKI